MAQVQRTRKSGSSASDRYSPASVGFLFPPNETLGQRQERADLLQWPSTVMCNTFPFAWPKVSGSLETREKKPRGYWKDIANVEKELRALADENGIIPLSTDPAVKNIRGALRRYHKTTYCKVAKRLELRTRRKERAAPLNEEEWMNLQKKYLAMIEAAVREFAVKNNGMAPDPRSCEGERLISRLKYWKGPSYLKFVNGLGFKTMAQAEREERKVQRAAEAEANAKVRAEAREERRKEGALRKTTHAMEGESRLTKEELRKDRKAIEAEMLRMGGEVRVVPNSGHPAAARIGGRLKKHGITYCQFAHSLGLRTEANHQLPENRRPKGHRTDKWSVITDILALDNGYGLVPTGKYASAGKIQQTLYTHHSGGSYAKQVEWLGLRTGHPENEAERLELRPPKQMERLQRGRVPHPEEGPMLEAKIGRLEYLINTLAGTGGGKTHALVNREQRRKVLFAVLNWGVLKEEHRLEQRTLQDVADDFGLTRERIRQILERECAEDAPLGRALRAEGFFPRYLFGLRNNEVDGKKGETTAQA